MQEQQGTQQLAYIKDTSAISSLQNDDHPE